MLCKHQGSKKAGPLNIPQHSPHHSLRRFTTARREIGDIHLKRSTQPLLPSQIHPPPSLQYTLRDGIATGDPGCPERLRSKLLFSEDLLLSPSDLAHGFPAYRIIQRRRDGTFCRFSRNQLQYKERDPVSGTFQKEAATKFKFLKRASFGDFHGEAPQDLFTFASG